MIRHIVLFSAKNVYDVKVIYNALKRLASIPGPNHFEVKLNDKRDPLSKEIDIVLYAEFPDYQALDAYQTHSDYQKTTEIVRPLRNQRVVADYVVD